MKTMLLSVSLLIFASCNKAKEAEKSPFITQLIECTYDERYLPDLSPTDISSLLSHRNDKTILCKYPANPISSFYSDEVTAGMFALWTIESIRITELNNTDQPQARFPSLNPILSDDKDQTKDQNDLQDAAAEKYQDWWSSGMIESEKIKVNPLEETNIVWR